MISKKVKLRITFLFLFLSPLVNSEVMENPFFTEYETNFKIPPFSQINEDHFMPAFIKGMELHNEEINGIIGNKEEPSFENIIVAMERSGSLLSRVSAVFFNLSGSTTNPKIQEIEKEREKTTKDNQELQTILEDKQTDIKNAVDELTALNVKARKDYDLLLQQKQSIQAKIKEISELKVPKAIEDGPDYVNKAVEEFVRNTKHKENVRMKKYEEKKQKHLEKQQKRNELKQSMNVSFLQSFYELLE